VNPVNPTAELQTREVQEAARALGRQIVVVNASSEDEFETAFARLVQLGAGALLVAAEPIFESWRDRIVALTARHAVPAIYQARESVVAGGLMSYGPSFADAVRQAGIYVGRILTGEKPADLPVQQSVKVELVINMKTAKALGLSFPLSLLGRADEVIE
jgi:putative ABC transport system substrate-binding protein